MKFELNLSFENSCNNVALYKCMSLLKVKKPFPGKRSISTRSGLWLLSTNNTNLMNILSEFKVTN